MSLPFAVIVPWWNPDQFNAFLKAWGLRDLPEWFFGQQDEHKEGCAVTKNKGIQRALDAGAEVVMVLDDDCFNCGNGIYGSLEGWADWHLQSLEPQPVELYEAVTVPHSRGTPYFNRTVTMPVAASMGFWTGVQDYDAPTQLVSQGIKMDLRRKTMFWRFFPFSGMNCAFRAEFWPFFKFEEGVGRFDDIFMGYRLQAEAYKRGYCINLNGPLVRHARQSNLWANLRTEAEFMERNETEWTKYV